MAVNVRSRGNRNCCLTIDDRFLACFPLWDICVVSITNLYLCIPWPNQGIQQDTIASIG